MSLWKKMLGLSKKANGPEQGRRETQIIKEPEHDLASRAPDDLMVLEKKEILNNLDNKKENLSNKDSP
jgi:hypothetical protein